MLKPTAPIKEVSRLLDLVPYLSTHSHISLKELSVEFGVTEREMANELTALSMCGLPGYTPYELIEIFFDSGFVTINNHEALDIPRALTSLEVASLLIGLEILRDSLFGTLQDEIDTTLVEEKKVATRNEIDISRRIDSLITQLASLLGKVIEVAENPISTSTQLAQRAIASRRNLSISYLSPSRDEISERLIHPLSLYTENGFTYLSAFCTKSSGYRNFRLDRVVQMVESGEMAGESPIETPLSEPTQTPLKVHGRRRDVAELFNLSTIPNDGRITLNSFSSTWVDRAVAAYSPDIEVEAMTDQSDQSDQRKKGNQRESAKSYLENILDLYRS